MIQGCSSVAEVSSEEVFTTGCQAMDCMVGYMETVSMETDCTMVSTEMVSMVTGSMETDCTTVSMVTDFTETVFMVAYMGLEEAFEDMER